MEMILRLFKSDFLYFLASIYRNCNCTKLLACIQVSKPSNSALKLGFNLDEYQL